MKVGDEITLAEANKLLDGDLKRVEDAVNRLVASPIDQNQFDALVSFVFNIGEERFKKSKLLKELNAGWPENVPGELRRWTKATIDGKQVELAGVKKRREKEAELWGSPA